MIYMLDNTGKVIMKIGSILSKEKINRSKLSREAKIQYRQAKTYYEGNLQKVDLEILSRICHAFDLKISDILEYISVDDKNVK